VRSIAVWLRGAMAGAAVAYAGLFAWTGQIVGTAEAEYRAARYNAAHATLSRAAFWRVRSGRVLDAMGVVDLARGRIEEAGRHLNAARGGLFHPSAFGEQPVLVSFLREGLYEPARLYASHRLLLEPSAAASFFLGVAERGLGRLDDADKHLAAAQSDGSFERRAEAQRRLVLEARRTGRTDHFVDRAGAAIDPAALGLELRLEPRDRRGLVRLSLDAGIQNAAQEALGGRRGALVVLDVLTGGVLAAASHPAPSALGSRPPLALADIFEPGSIIKMITLAAALRSGVDVDRLFPLECPGSISIDGTVFPDWMPHHRVATVEDAVAVSCNIAFGRLAALVGQDALDAELRRYGFDPDTDPMGVSGADFNFAMGRLLARDTAHPAYALARRGIGLDSITITPVQAAILAAGLARGGVPPSLHAIEEKRNILDEVSYRAARGPAATDALPIDKAAVITRAMQAAVTSSSGTARRASVAGLSSAMKTGTSGKNPPGYDALVIGFAPAEKPRIAWALVAQGAGKAEWEGARITRAFLEKARSAMTSRP